MKKVLLVLSSLLALTVGWAADGQQVFAVCAGCHQASGQGMAGAFPPLAGELPRLAAAGEAGRNYLVQVVLFGLQGPIVAQGKNFNSVMPPQGHLSDEQVAAVLNYALGAWGNDKLLPKGFKPLTAAEVKALRAKQLTMQEVYSNWKSLNLK